MSKTYAIADLHGRADLLKMAVKEIRSRDATGTIVTLGDYIDRGPESRQAIEYLMSKQDKNFVCLKGNHEDIMSRAYRQPMRNLNWWISNGGGQTIHSYGKRLDEIPELHVRWIESLPTYYEDKHRVFVHAGVKDGVPLDKQTEEMLLWYLYPDDHEGGWNGKHVVHGHHQFPNGPIVKTGRTDLDTLAWLNGRLVVGVFDDKVPGGAVDFIEIKGKPDIRDIGTRR